MSDSSWIITLDRVLTQLQSMLSLPTKTIRGFDGDAWLWIWRSPLQVSNEEITTEIQVRAKPTAIGRQISLTIVASAWKTRDREPSLVQLHVSTEPTQISDYEPLRNKLRERLYQANLILNEDTLRDVLA